jgi:cytoskeletal protein CcmA (bactofilin family)
MQFGKPKDPESISSSISLGAPVISSGGMAGNSDSSGKADAFLGKGTKIVGTLTFTGAAEINGQVEGEVISQERLIIGESAVVNAKITGGEIVVKGTVNGDITASKRLILQRPAKITGNLTTSNLTIEEGVVFEGKCSMNTSAATTDRKKEPLQAVAR